MEWERVSSRADAFPDWFGPGYAGVTTATSGFGASPLKLDGSQPPATTVG